MAMAFMVKSRLARSSVRFLVNETLSGLRESEYSPSILKVVISKGSPLTKTVTVPCLRPVGTVVNPLKTFITCSGSASVVMSWS